MSEPSVQRQAVVANPQGMHARPVDTFVKLAIQFESKIDVIKDGQRVNGKSILDVLTLGAEQGAQLTIEAVGPDAAHAVEALAEIVEQESFGGEPSNE